MELFGKQKRSIPIQKDYASFKEYLLSR